jgi:hypothetical protein
MKALFSLMLVLVVGTANAACFTFDGKEYCPPDSEQARPCTSASCLTPNYGLKLPETKVTVYVPEPVVIAPTDKNGQPSAFANYCEYGCGVAPAPMVVRPYVVVPQTIWWYQPPPVEVPTVIVWRPWDTMTGNPPLKRHR